MPATSNPPYGDVPPFSTWNSQTGGAAFGFFLTEEEITLATTGPTTDSSTYLLPANSIILCVTGVITEAIAGSVTNWQLGDSGAAGRFSAVDTTKSIGEAVPKTSFPPVQIGTGVASGTAGVYQAAAAKVRVTTTGGGNPTAGKIRVVVFGLQITNPSS